MHDPHLPVAALGLVALLAAPGASGQTYEIAWHTVDGGGGVGTTGGPFVLSGTAGQPDASTNQTGGAYSLSGGFWAVTLTAGGGTADLAVTKSDGQASAIPGQAVSYTIAVTSAGPDAATGATVTDALVPALTGATWTCVASPGSTCTASGNGSINDSVSLLPGGTLTYTLTATVDPAATGSLANTATVTPPPGFTDPVPGNNSATDTDALTPQADLALAKSDVQDPVHQNGIVTYAVTVTNNGPSASPGMSVTDALPAGLTFVSANPGPPACTHSSGTVTCNLGALAPLASVTVTITGTVNPGILGTLTNTAAVAGTHPDPVPGNDADTETTSVILRMEGELSHGSRLRADLAALPGPVADEDRRAVRQEPYSSYEAVVDEAAGDLGAGSGPLLERMAVDGTTSLQEAVAAGAGPARSLRWQNTTSTVVVDQHVRVRSGSCSTDCGSDDVYRIRLYDTSYRVPRLNNTGTQVTVLIVQNTTDSIVAGRAYFWSAAGALLATHSFTLSARQTLTLNTATVPGAASAAGTLTVTSDAPYGALAGKAVALEPSTGFSFDSPMVPRPR